MNRLLVLAFFSLNFIGLNGQDLYSKNFYSKTQELERKAIHLHTESSRGPNRYFQEINFFVDSATRQLTKVLSDTFTDKWIIETYYWQNGDLISVQVDTRNEHNETIAETRLYYYNRRKPQRSPSNPHPRSAYKKYLKKGDHLLSRSTQYTIK